MHPFNIRDHEMKMSLPIFAENTLYVGCIELYLKLFCELEWIRVEYCMGENLKKRLMLMIELSFFANKWNHYSQILFDSW